LSPDGAGNAQICLYNGENWRPNLTFHHVLVKAKMWLLAYEMHRRTGKPISDYLRTA
ncbi:MAG: hypothetical protein JWO48_3448, partial [Bryobacterales bacterium]|nr:hypothetical protein [Bryobacterales bacterium]